MAPTWFQRIFGGADDAPLPLSIPPMVTPPPLTIALAPAPEVHALPITPGDPLDIAVNHLWAAFRRSNPNGSWDAFTASLRGHNTQLVADIRQAQRDAEFYPPNARYKP